MVPRNPFPVKNIHYTVQHIGDQVLSMMVSTDRLACWHEWHEHVVGNSLAGSDKDSKSEELLTKLLTNHHTLTVIMWRSLISNINNLLHCNHGNHTFRKRSLVPRPFSAPVFDHLQYAKTEGEGLGESCARRQVDMRVDVREVVPNKKCRGPSCNILSKNLRL